MSAHTHDEIAWATRLSSLRRLDSLEHDALSTVASRLTAGLPSAATVVDVGSGAGGMSAALAAALKDLGGGSLILVDAVDELLEAAREAAQSDGGHSVGIETLVADAGSAELSDLLPGADLIWASSVVHHLPDQQLAVNRLASSLKPGGLLALAEGGLETRFLPWDLGIGTPGLEQRLSNAHEVWFERLRANMTDVVRMPYGWATALRTAGLADVSSSSYLIDYPAPVTGTARDFVLERFTGLAEIAEDHLDESDRAVVQLLLDETGREYIGARDDLYVLYARTVYLGRRP